jgi:hypothetical protein
VRSGHIHADGWAGFLALFRLEAALNDGLIEFFPLRDAVYWLLWHGFGHSATPFHVTALVFHALASVLVGALAVRLGLSRWVALVSALLFATHPVHTESVVWVSGLKDPLFLSAMLGSMVCYLNYRSTLRPLQYGASLVLLALALSCKSLALPTPLLMVAAERLIGKPTPWVEIIKRVAGPFLVLVPFVISIGLMGKETNVVTGPHGGSWSSHWTLMSWAMVLYVQQAILPANFRLYYCFTPAQGVADPRLWVAVVVAASLLALGVFFFRRDKALAFAWLWFFACLGPVANIVPFPSLMNDRYLYAPSVGAVWVMAWAISQLRFRQALAIAVVATLAVVTAIRAQVWHREADLWNEVAEEKTCWEDRSMLALNALVQWALTQTETDKALEAFGKTSQHSEFLKYRGDYTCERFHRSFLVDRQADPEAELRAAEMMVTYCPKMAAAWERLAVANWDRRPAIAQRAMDKAYAIEPTIFRRWRQGLLRFSVHDPRAVGDISSALDWNPSALCPTFRVWIEKVPPDRRAEVQGLAEKCPGH